MDDKEVRQDLLARDGVREHVADVENPVVVDADLNPGTSEPASSDW